MAKQQVVSANKDNIKSATVHAAAVAEPHPIFLQPQYILLILGLPILGLTVHQAVLHSKLTALDNRRCPEVNSNQCAEKVVGRRQSVNSSDLQYAERVEAPVATKRVLFEKDQELIVGNTTYHPSFGLFPEGCRWRLVTQSNASGHSYQYWDFDSHDWSDERPDACIPTSYPPPGPSNWSFYRDSPRTEVTCEKSHCMYTNLYYNNGRWYALVDGELYIPSWKFSRNQEIVTLHVQNATDFMKPISYRVVPGDTILFDFIFFIHPTAIGHWWEMLGPLYSILKSANFKRPCDQFILLHLQRQHMLEWVRAMIAVTLGVGLDQELPPVLVQEETDNAWHQISESGCA